MLVFKEEGCIRWDGMLAKENILRKETARMYQTHPPFIHAPIHALLAPSEKSLEEQRVTSGNQTEKE